MAADTWKRLSWQMGTNKAMGKVGRMINIICRPFLSPLLINHPALQQELCLFSFLLWSSVISYHFLSNLLIFPSSVCVCVCARARARVCISIPNQLWFPILCSFPLFLQWGFAGEKPRTFPLPLGSFLTIFLLLMSNNFPAPGNTNSFPFLETVVCCPHYPSLKIQPGLLSSLSAFFFFFLLEDFNKWIRSALCLLRVYIFWCPAWQQAGSFSWKNMGFGSSQPLVYLLFFFLSY